MSVELKILFSSTSGILILSRPEQFRSAWLTIERYLASGRGGNLQINAALPGAHPYERSLSALTIEVTNGPVTALAVDDYLRVCGSRANLEIYFGHMKFDEDSQPGDHHHPEHVDKQDYVSRNSVPVVFEIE